MLIVAVLTRARDTELAVGLRVQVEAFGAVGARREVLALLSRMQEGTVRVVAGREESTAHVLLAGGAAILVLVALLDGPLQVYLLGATRGERSVLLLSDRIRVETSCTPLPLCVGRAVLAERAVLLLWADHATIPVVRLLSKSSFLLRLKLLMLIILLIQSLSATLLHVEGLLDLPGFLLSLMDSCDPVAKRSASLALGLPVVLAVAASRGHCTGAIVASLVNAYLRVLTLVTSDRLALSHDLFEAHALVLLVHLVGRIQSFALGLRVSLSEVVSRLDDLQRRPLQLLALLSHVWQRIRDIGLLCNWQLENCRVSQGEVLDGDHRKQVTC